ncbi:MAG: SpoIID/LytB domain-containing protein, partial [Clostridia bacterium]
FTSTAAADTLKSKIGGTVVGNSKTCVTVYASESGSALFEYDGGTYTCLGVYPSLNTAAMPLTWFKSMQWYGGFEYPRNGGNMTIVNVVPMQYYIKGVIPYEMSPDSPLEALKAQAMCARTFAYYNTGKHGRLFDVCCTTDCQVYFGAERASNNSDRAVDETQGKYILYDGEPINAVFHSADGGATEDVENIWGSFIPYLRGKVDPYEDLEHALNGIWSYEYTPQELTDILNAKGYKAALISDAYVAEYTKLGNVLKVVFVDVNGKEWPFLRERARTIINSTSMKKYTRSQRYTIKRTGSAGGGMINVNGTATINPFDGKTTVIGSGGIITIPPDGKLSVITANGKESIKSAAGSSGNFIISGTGWGHNVGMSQEGAAGMAKKGFLAEDIIHFYFTGVTITK